MNCECNLPAELKVTKNPDSTNYGRSFFSCPKGRSGCRYFTWASSGGTQAPPAPVLNYKRRKLDQESESISVSFPAPVPSISAKPGLKMEDMFFQLLVEVTAIKNTQVEMLKRLSRAYPPYPPYSPPGTLNPDNDNLE